MLLINNNKTNNNIIYKRLGERRELLNIPINI